MSITNTTVLAIYNGNGATTSFAVPGTTHSFSDNSEIKVLARAADGTETVKTVTTHYTLVGGNPATSITMLVAPASGTQLVIYRDSAKTQATQYYPQLPIPAASLEGALDKLTRLHQEADYDLRRIPKFKISDTTHLDLEIDAPVANAMLLWNPTGTGIVNGGTAGDIAAAQANAAAAAASASTAGASAFAAGTSATNAATSATNAAAAATTAANTAVAAAINDTAYAGSWDADTTHAPSKNAVYDKIQTVLAGIPVVSNTAYGASWSSVTTDAPSKQAVYNKIESFAAVYSTRPLQVASTTTGAVSAPTAVAQVLDDTIPTSTEGAAYSTLSTSITPKFSTSTLLYEATLYISTTIARDIVVSVFRDASAAATAAGWITAAANTYGCPIVVRFTTPALNTAGTTFSVRIGTTAGEVVTLNGVGGARKLGGILLSTVTITELSV